MTLFFTPFHKLHKNVITFIEPNRYFKTLESRDSYHNSKILKAHGDHLGDLKSDGDVGADDVPHGLQGDWLLFSL